MRLRELLDLHVVDLAPLRLGNLNHLEDFGTP
jgi:hypothetical protein